MKSCLSDCGCVLVGRRQNIHLVLVNFAGVQNDGSAGTSLPCVDTKDANTDTGEIH